MIKKQKRTFRKTGKYKREKQPQKVIFPYTKKRPYVTIFPAKFVKINMVCCTYDGIKKKVNLLQLTKAKVRRDKKGIMVKVIRNQESVKLLQVMVCLKLIIRS